MRGLITSAEWLGLNPHRYITDLKGYYGNNRAGAMIPLNY